MTQTAKTCAVVGAVVSLIVVSLAIATADDAHRDGTARVFQGDSPRLAVIDAWKDKGLATGGFGSIVVPQLDDADCESGAAGGLQVLLCRYPSIDAAAVAPEAAEPLIGDATGAALSAGKLLIVATDRYGADPDGKNLNLLLNTFRSTAAGQAL